ncbi:MAG: ATP-binding protein [Alphaproteobacteria bacterium]
MGNGLGGKFIGRKDELDKLNLLLSKKSASLVVVRGRRRIGKSRLVEEFGKSHSFLRFSGISPTKDVTPQFQRDIFIQQLFQQLNLPLSPGGWTTAHWSDIFRLLADHTREGRVTILFDEISWMGSQDPTFLGQLKNAWDMEFKKNPRLILVLCGSVSTWIEENIIKSTGFFGRISSYINLEELTLPECNQFLEAQGFRTSDYEKLKVISVTGGIPWYLEQIQPQLSSDQNIKNLCFRKDGILVTEFDMIFHDLFIKKSENYKRIVNALSKGSSTFNDLCQELLYEKGGVLSGYLDDLMKAGFIRRDYTWHPKTGKVSRLSHYRLNDNFLRFYLKYIEPNLSRIERDTFKDVGISSLPGWDTLMGFQFENLVLHNRRLVRKLLHCLPEDIVYDNPYFQRKTNVHEGCQIDYLVQTRHQLMFACEIKFSRNKIKQDIIQDMKDKLSRLALPRGFACSPVLIHVNGIDDAVIDADYFSSIIDFGSLLHAR